ncbi:MAG: YncE family protein [Marinifilaceae bacterium]
MNNIYIALISLCLITGCSNEIIETNVIVNKEYDTTRYYAHFYRHAFNITQTNTTDIEFTPYSTQIDGDILYIGNRANKTVYGYHLKEKRYVSEYTNAGRTDPLSIIATQDYLFVACGDFREVQIFDKHTGEYLSRLGNGVWSGSVSYATSITHSKDYVFIRDSKDIGIRVFRKADINHTATNNTSYYMNLNIDKLYTSGVNPSPVDMEVLGDSLYVFDTKSARVYIYSIQAIDSKDPEYIAKMQFDINTPTGIANIFGMESTSNGQTIILKLKYNNRIGYAHYSRDKFTSLDWSQPDIIVYREQQNDILQSGGFTAYNNQIVYPVNNTLFISDFITEESFSIITPQ